MPKSMMLTLPQHTQRRTKSACYATYYIYLHSYTRVYDCVYLLLPAEENKLLTVSEFCALVTRSKN